MLSVLLQAPKTSATPTMSSIIRFPAHDLFRPIPIRPKSALSCRAAPLERRPRFYFWSFPMSALFSATALVVPFENLRMSDVEAVGGKNASLGEMISQLPQGV